MLKRSTNVVRNGAILKGKSGSFEGLSHTEKAFEIVVNTLVVQYQPNLKWKAMPNTLNAK